ncbi:ROK family protein [Thalassoglobus polymorphus]|uniref:Glucokinase n=1 Tax=Thalassoglobus polymorphus TaxID=2527994 RepID=A0A517QQL7_9PLAN|nr:ROK family protein [Thalassoglobus polymorphus]QDT33889.1 Glucokinase [Thalassoglobus polymorphus]
MTDEQYFLGVDIGGTSIKVGVVSSEGQTIAKLQAPSVKEGTREEGLSSLYLTMENVVKKSEVGWDRIDGIGVAAPGTMDIHTGVVFHPFNLPGWENLPLRDLVSERFKKPTVLHNDANAAAYGECWQGAAKDSDSLMLWTLGTGIGGGIVINRKIVTGAHSHAGECGHMIIQAEGGPYSEHGIHGSLELFAGAKALVRRCKAALASGARSIVAQEIAKGEELTPLLIANCANADDDLANRLIMETGRYLALGTINIMHSINPDMILIGGAMTFGKNETALGRRFLENIRVEVRKHTFPIPAEKTRIEYAALGKDAGFIGAAGCILAHLEKGA